MAVHVVYAAPRRSSRLRRSRAADSEAQSTGASDVALRVQSLMIIVENPRVDPAELDAFRVKGRDKDVECDTDVARVRSEDAAAHHLDRDFVVNVDGSRLERRACELRDVASEHGNSLNREGGGDDARLGRRGARHGLTSADVPHLRSVEEGDAAGAQERESARPRAPTASSEVRVSSAQAAISKWPV